MDCLTTGPQTPPKRGLQRLLLLSCSFLQVIEQLLTSCSQSTRHSILTSIRCFRRQYQRKSDQFIQPSFCILYIGYSSLPSSVQYFISRTVLQRHVSKLSSYICLHSEVSIVQHLIKLCSNRSISFTCKHEHNQITSEQTAALHSARNLVLHNCNTFPSVPTLHDIDGLTPAAPAMHHITHSVQLAQSVKATHPALCNAAGLPARCNVF